MPGLNYDAADFDERSPAEQNLRRMGEAPSSQPIRKKTIRTQILHRSVLLKNKRPEVFSRLLEVVTSELHIEDTSQLRDQVARFTYELLGQFNRHDFGT